MKALLFSAPVMLIVGLYVTYKYHLALGLFIAKVVRFARGRK